MFLVNKTDKNKPTVVDIDKEVLKKNLLLSPPAKLSVDNILNNDLRDFIKRIHSGEVPHGFLNEVCSSAFWSSSNSIQYVEEYDKHINDIITVINSLVDDIEGELNSIVSSSDVSNLEADVRGALLELFNNKNFDNISK